MFNRLNIFFSLDNSFLPKEYSEAASKKIEDISNPTEVKIFSSSISFEEFSKIKEHAVNKQEARVLDVIYYGISDEQNSWILSKESREDFFNK